MHPLYRYAYVTDRYEGLVVVDVDMLADGDPLNNFLERVATFNPDGVLDGARYITIAGDVRLRALQARARRGEHRGSRSTRVWSSELGAPDLVEPRAIHDPVPLRLRDRRARAPRARRHPARSAALRGVARLPEAGDLTVVPHLRVRAGRLAGSRDRRRRAADEAGALPDVQRRRRAERHARRTGRCDRRERLRLRRRRRERAPGRPADHARRDAWQCRLQPEPDPAADRDPPDARAGHRTLAAVSSATGRSTRAVIRWRSSAAWARGPLRAPRWSSSSCGVATCSPSRAPRPGSRGRSCVRSCRRPGRVPSADPWCSPRPPRKNGSCRAVGRAARRMGRAEIGRPVAFFSSRRGSSLLGSSTRRRCRAPSATSADENDPLRRDAACSTHRPLLPHPLAP